MRRLLVVVDMQNDFIDGSLGTEEAKAIVDRVVAKIGEYPAENILVTRDTHPADYLKSREGRYLPVDHCIENTEGWRLGPDIEKALSEKGGNIRYFNKNGFGSVELAEHMAELAGGDEISVELIGLCTDICVVFNAMLIKSFLPETDICVDASCCAGVTPEKHRAALEVMRSCQIDILNG